MKGNVSQILNLGPSFLFYDNKLYAIFFNNIFYNA